MVLIAAAWLLMAFMPVGWLIVNCLRRIAAALEKRNEAETWK